LGHFEQFWPNWPFGSYWPFETVLAVLANLGHFDQCLAILNNFGHFVIVIVIVIVGNMANMANITPSENHLFACFACLLAWMG
jgi:hypothetical protein